MKRILILSLSAFICILAYAQPMAMQPQSTYEQVDDVRKQLNLDHSQFEKVYAAYDKYNKAIFGNKSNGMTMPAPPAGGRPGGQMGNYDADENDTSSAAGIKTDGNVIISGGTISIKSCGTGGKGINADGNLNVTGGETTVVTTGGKFVYNAALDLDSSPKGIKADGNITIDEGTVNIMVTGVSDGSEGLESKADLTINGGNIYVYAYDDAINAAKSITVNDGRIYAYAVNNDGIDSNGTMTFNGGLTISNGSRAPEEAFDCDRSNDLKVNGGTLIGVAGGAISPSSSINQKTVIYNGIQFAKDQIIAILDETGKPIMAYSVPRSLNGSLFFSSKDLKDGATYQVSSNGKISGDSNEWNGWYDGGSWSDGNSIGSFTVNGSITTIGTSSGPGGGGFPGGNRPW